MHIDFLTLFNESLRDLFDIKYQNRSTRQAYLAAIEWLSRAQDKTLDGGVSAWYSPIQGWRPSYIETTGYIIETFVNASKFLSDPLLLKRAERMGDFLIAQQLDSGGYRSHTIYQKETSYPTVFDTGQDILGMCALYKLTKKKKYIDSAIKAADFLVEIQDDKGYWLRNTFGNTCHIYHTRVAWPLLEVQALTRNKKYYVAADKFFSWALAQQTDTGWFKYAELIEKNQQNPHTHTLCYTTEGFLYAGIRTQDSELLMAAIKSAIPPLKRFLETGYLPATFDSDWHSTDQYMCLTGNAQYAVVWGELYNITKQEYFKEGLKKMNSILISTQSTSNNKNIAGAIKGSLPIYGNPLNNTGYCRFAYLNWATKYFADALLLELTQKEQ